MSLAASPPPQPAEDMSPRPSLAHADLSHQLATELENVFGRSGPRRGGPGGWFFLQEPELQLAGAPRNLIPDLAGWRRTRLPHLPRKAALDLAPDWVCEVLSTSTAAKDRIWKLPLYFSAGVSHVWLVNPVLRYVEAFGRGDQTWILLGAYSEQDAAVRIPPFEGQALPLAELWPDLDGEEG
ncbi:MAG: Uma2 family endonuclease [Polyangia bacterium]